MPVTPNFTISQTDVHIVINISVPHVRVTPESVEVALSDANHKLHWSSPPYLLVLTFEHAFSEAAEEACATYKPTIQNGVIQLQLAKAEPGVRWTDLDLVGKLLPTRSTNASSKWLHEVTTDTKDEPSRHERNLEEEEFDMHGYGFFRMFKGIFSDWTRDGLAREMFESPWQDDIDGELKYIRTQRRRARLEMEQNMFCADRYLQDMDCQDDYIFMSAMSMQPHWMAQSHPSLEAQLKSLKVSDDDNVYFTPEEATQLASIPYPLLPTKIAELQKVGLLLGLTDILFAYVYDHILTDAEPTVESAWTVSILSASFSWLDDWMDDAEKAERYVTNVVCSSMRRSLTYPYLRNLPLAITVWQHVSVIMRQGRRCVIRCLLQVRSILDHSELYYLSNKLFVDPYMAWLQRCDNEIESTMIDLAIQIENAISKKDELYDELHLGLTEIEATILAQESQIQYDSEASTSSGDSESVDEDDNSSTDSEEIVKPTPAIILENTAIVQRACAEMALPVGALSGNLPKHDIDVSSDSERKVVLEVVSEESYDE